MTQQSNPRPSIGKKALVAVWCICCFLGAFAMALDAQEEKKADADPKDKAGPRHPFGHPWQPMWEFTGLSRQAAVFDFDRTAIEKQVTPQHLKTLITTKDFGEFADQYHQLGKKELLKTKITGYSVWFTVLENTSLPDDDAETNTSNIEHSFQEGRSHEDTYSPSFDRKARYLYLYQVVNDRHCTPSSFVKDIESTDPDVIKEVEGKKAGSMTLAAFATQKASHDANKVAEKEALTSYAVRLPIRDPRYITSWGYFPGASLASNVPDIGSADVIKQVAAGMPIEKEKKLIAVSTNPSILENVTRKEYTRQGRAQLLNNKLKASFGVHSQARLPQTEFYNEIKTVAGAISKKGGGLKLAGGEDNQGAIKFVVGIDNATKSNITLVAANMQKSIETGGIEPDIVEIQYPTKEERINDPANPITEAEPNCILYVEWNRTDKATGEKVAINNGQSSVVFGFTSDLRPRMTVMSAGGGPKATDFLKSVPMHTRFSTEAYAKAVGDALKREAQPRKEAGLNRANAGYVASTNEGRTQDGYFFTSFVDPLNNVEEQHFVQAPAASLSTGLDRLLGNTPGESPGPGGGGGGGAPGFSGMSGGSQSAGGAAPGGGGALSIPGLGSMGRSGGGGGMTGGGGNPGSGSGTGQTAGQGQNQNSNVPSIDFTATLTNLQQQQQQQQQKQGQGQHQHGGHGHHHGGGHGHVVPAPPALLLGMLGLPGLFFLLRRKPEEVAIA